MWWSIPLRYSIRIAATQHRVSSLPADGGSFVLYRIRPHWVTCNRNIDCWYTKEANAMLYSNTDIPTTTKTLIQLWWRHSLSDNICLKYQTVSGLKHISMLSGIMHHHNFRQCIHYARYHFSCALNMRERKYIQERKYVLGNNCLCCAFSEIKTSPQLQSNMFER